MKRLAVGLLLLAGSASAHRLDEYLQATLLGVTPTGVEVEIQLTPGVAVFPSVLTVLDRNLDGTLSVEEQQAYAEWVLRDLELRLDGRKALLRVVGSQFSSLQEIHEGLGSIRLKMRTDRTGNELRFVNHHLPELSAYLVNCLATPGDGLTVGKQERDEAQKSIGFVYSFAQQPSNWSTWPLGLGLAVAGWVVVQRRKVLLALLALPLTAQVPRTWTQAAVDTLELPLASAANSPVHIREEAYYKIPERVLYKTYTVYAPGREPEGYQAWLKSREPEVAFDAGAVQTKQQWIEAGEVVFNAPTSFGPMFFTAENLRDPNFFKTQGMPVARDGTIPFARWVIRKKGTVELGSMGCNTCHTRVLADGTVVPGAQGNNANDRQGAQLLRLSPNAERVRGFARQFEMPWLSSDINKLARTMSLAEFVAAGEAIPPGVSARANTSMLLPPQIPDLIGVRERTYLDHTGLIRQRDIGDLMRYSSLAQDLFTQDRYGASDPLEPKLPSVRYSDSQLYALAQYLYSLKPPANTNPFDASAKRGKQVFEAEKCGTCHTPPFYTSNKLVAVDGFQPPPNAPDVLPVRVGTDPRYALESHKGTGYYKVPPLKGVWYRGPLSHNGAAATLEEWFDPARLRPDYIPQGFRGYDGKARSIPGHPFALKRSAVARKDLIAFLRTL